MPRTSAVQAVAVTAGPKRIKMNKNVLLANYKQHKPPSSFERWRQLRNHILIEAVGVADGATPQASLEVHHVRTVQHGGTDTPNDLAALCRSCHAVVHADAFEVEVRAFAAGL